MMKLSLSIITALFLALLGRGASRESTAPAAPTEDIRLVVLVAVDQMRYDYLPRFSSSFSGGLRRLTREGAVFTNAHLDHYPTVTAVGHATMLTGAPPSLSGIIGNEWYDRVLMRNVTSVADPATKLLGGRRGAAGASPHRMRISTLGDELKMFSPASRVVGLSQKDRSAILMVGRRADLALWWDTQTGEFVSSTWYAAELPKWVVDFNAGKPADAWLNQEWKALGEGGSLLDRLPATPGPAYYGRLLRSPFGNDLLVSMAEAVLEHEQLGSRGAVDLLALSFSCNDVLGHDTGPHSPEITDITRRTDLAIERLLSAIDRRVGLSKTIVVLTADHGVSPVPEQMAAWKMPGGRLSTKAIEKAAGEALEADFGPGTWIAGRTGSSIYLNRALLAERKLDPAMVERRLANGVETLAGIWRVFTRSQILEGRLPADPWSRRVLLSFDRERSGDAELLYLPYWMTSSQGTTHGTPYSYDTHIPLILMGPGIRPGRFTHPAVLNDLAPTLATLLGVETPSGSSGRVLTEILQEDGARK